MKFKKSKLLVLLVVIFSFVSCNTDENLEQNEIETIIAQSKTETEPGSLINIQDYLSLTHYHITYNQDRVEESEIEEIRNHYLSIYQEDLYFYPILQSTNPFEELWLRSADRPSDSLEKELDDDDDLDYLVGSGDGG